MIADGADLMIEARTGNSSFQIYEEECRHQIRTLHAEDVKLYQCVKYMGEE